MEISWRILQQSPPLARVFPILWCLELHESVSCRSITLEIARQVHQGKMKTKIRVKAHGTLYFSANSVDVTFLTFLRWRLWRKAIWPLHDLRFVVSAFSVPRREVWSSLCGLMFSTLELTCHSWVLLTVVTKEPSLHEELWTQRIKQRITRQWELMISHCLDNEGFHCAATYKTV